nr:MAG: hypothetical protein [Microvirus sp.]
MKEILLREFLYPTLTRVGSLAAGAMVGAGMAQDHEAAVATGLAAMMAFGVDLITRKFVK